MIGFIMNETVTRKMRKGWGDGKGAVMGSV